MIPLDHYLDGFGSTGTKVRVLNGICNMGLLEFWELLDFLVGWMEGFGRKRPIRWTNRFFRW